MRHRYLLCTFLGLTSCLDATGSGGATTAEVGHCGNGALDGDETDLDCGGTGCGPCSPSRRCKEARDCTTGFCTAAGVCGLAPATCSDGVKNGTESDIDCGGGCPTCVDGRSCVVASDCTSKSCSGTICRAPTCTDKVQNGTETDIDCGGGACPPCDTSASCSKASDCKSGLCDGLHCRIPQSCLEGKSVGWTADGVYRIDPDGLVGANAPFDVFCDQTTDGGGWTFFAHVNDDYGGGQLFQSVVGVYRADRGDDGTTYSVAGLLLPFIAAKEKLVLLDSPNPSIAAAAKKLVVFEHSPTSGGFLKGPIPCADLSGFRFRRSASGPSIDGVVAGCDAIYWYPRTTEGFLTLFVSAPNRGQFWGAGMGGDESWNHDGYWFAR